jgi:hypothetical protein
VTSTNETSQVVDVQTCHLLRLPGELRNRIYEEANFQPPSSFTSHHTSKSLYPREPVLAFTCKLIRHEVLSAFYAQIQFSISNIEALLDHAPHVFTYLRHVDVPAPVYLSQGIIFPLGFEMWQNGAESLDVAPTAQVSVFGSYCCCKVQKIARAAEADAKLESKSALLICCEAMRTTGDWALTLHRPDECPEKAS